MATAWPFNTFFLAISRSLALSLTYHANGKPLVPLFTRKSGARMVTWLMRSVKAQALARAPSMRTSRTSPDYSNNMDQLVARTCKQYACQVCACRARTWVEKGFPWSPPPGKIPHAVLPPRRLILCRCRSQPISSPTAWSTGCIRATTK